MYKKKNVTVMVMLTNLLPDPSHLPCPLSLIEVLLVVLQSLDWSLSEWESCYCDLGERLTADSLSPRSQEQLSHSARDQSKDWRTTNKTSINDIQTSLDLISSASAARICFWHPLKS